MLERLFAAHYEGLLRYAYLLTGSRMAAEDLVHDAFVRLWGAADRLDERGAVAYARRTILNLERSNIRKALRRRNRSRVEPVDAVDDLPDSSRTDVLRALGALTRLQRACLALRYYEDLPIAEIAAQMELTEDAVKKHLGRGLERLRPLLGEEAIP